MKSSTGILPMINVPENTMSTEGQGSSPTTSTVSIRRLPGLVLEGMAAHPDGLSFRATTPLAGGEVLEIVLCDTIIVEMEVVGSVPLPAREDGFLVRARFLNIPPELARPIYQEMARLLRQEA